MRSRMHKRRKRRGRVFGSAFVWLWIVLSAFPLVFMVSSALKTQTDALAIPPKWMFHPTLAPFRKVWDGTGGTPPFKTLLAHSVILTTAITFATVIFGTLGAYALTFKRFRPRKFLSSWVLSTYMFPAIVAVTPVYYVENKFNLIGSYPGFIIPEIAFNLPIVIWLVRRGIQQLPVEIEEAAMIDGAGTMRTLWSIVNPLLGPVIATAAILTAILTWNEFLFGSSLGSAGTQTAPSALLSFTGLYGTRYDLLSAASLMVAAPVILLAIILRRRLISGLTLGAVK